MHRQSRFLCFFCGAGWGGVGVGVKIVNFNGSGTITSVGEERANLSAVVYL